jgi:hypothetical protein
MHSRSIQCTPDPATFGPFDHYISGRLDQVVVAMDNCTDPWMLMQLVEQKRRLELMAGAR